MERKAEEPPSKTFERKDPITGKVATVAAAASLADVDTVAEAARKSL